MGKVAMLQEERKRVTKALDSPAYDDVFLSGGSRTRAAALEAMIMEMGPLAAGVLAEIMADPDVRPQIRVEVARYVLDRSLGRPAERVQFPASHAGSIVDGAPVVVSNLVLEGRAAAALDDLVVSLPAPATAKEAEAV